MTTTTQEIVIGAGAEIRAGGVYVPLDLPVGSTITITVTIGPREATPAPEPAPQKPRHMGSGRINGGGAS